ncbi:MAG TPA: oligoribonuclease, partial [Gammaproteobacteria bacterium]|nr:oligoribonuclease [Gammaproteobacteria bacterium]
AIIEIATIVTDSELNVVAEGPVLAIHQPDARLSAMDDWNTNQHTQSGLVERVKASPLNEQDAERITLEFLEKHVPANTSPMCGNSICQDRRFLARCMPDLEQYFHYRNLDVSSVKELAKRWAPAMANGFHKNAAHLALEDVRDSIRELQYYREHFFRGA